MRKFLKGAVVLLIAVAMVFSSVAVTADTVKYEEVSPAAASIVEGGILTEKIITNPNQGGAPLLWDNGLPDARNGISCVLYPAYPLDRQVIDDFIVDGEGWYVTDGHFRIVTYYGSGPSAVVGVKVFFYANVGTDCNPELQVFEQRVANFNAYLTGNQYFYRDEIAVDCDFPKVFLSPGRWWVCFQPELDENCFWLTAESKECPIFVDHADLGFPRWTDSYTCFGEDYDMAFQITGNKKSKSLPTYVQFFELLKERSLLFRLLQQLF